MFPWDVNAAFAFPTMHCGTGPAGTFKTMAEDSMIFKTNSNPENAEKKSIVNSGESATRRRLSFSSGNEVRGANETILSCKVETLQGVPDDSSYCRVSAEMAEHPQQAGNPCLKSKNKLEITDFAPGQRLNSMQQSVDITENKENTAVSSKGSTTDDSREEGTSGQRNLQESSVTVGKQHTHSEDSNAEVAKRAQEEGRVDVVFPGTVTQEGCCRFVSEILKCILYQRQQLPMTYDQLVYSQKKQQASMQDKDLVSQRPAQSADMDWRKCQQTLQELEEVLQQLEVLFTLSRVPRVLLLLGGSLVLPKELYEINMEALEVTGGDQCLRVSSCLRQLFRTLFVADLLSDSRPVRLMPTTVLVLAHRDCGVGWFRPKLQFKVPTRVKNQIISLSTDPSTRNKQTAEGTEWQDYVWFQAPMNIKGFGK